jgi:ABC-type transport system involved in cytochrome c biogenesis permease subunit
MFRFARVVLFIAAVVEFVFRGIPALFGSPAVAQLFHLEYLPGFKPYVHAFGAVMICLGVLFYVASRAPEKHMLIVNVAILRFALGIAAQLGSYFQLGSLHVFWWVHMAVDLALVVLLIVARRSIVASHGETP